MRQFALAAISLTAFSLANVRVDAGVLTYGDKDVLGTRSYPVEPTTGATLEGLATGVVTFGAPSVSHGYPFSPSAGDFPGTDQIFVGSHQTGSHDGYSVAAQRIAGPQVLSLNYGPLVGAGQVVTSLTLGIAADDFQFPSFGQSFVATINGVAAPSLTAVLNSLSQTGPQVQFFSIGLSTNSLAGSNILTLRIDQGGDGGDGWAIDFLTVGVRTAAVSAVPEPSTLLSAAAGLLGLACSWRRLRTTMPT